MCKSETSFIVVTAPMMGQPLAARQAAPFLLSSPMADASDGDHAVGPGSLCSNSLRDGGDVEAVRLCEPGKGESVQGFAHVSGTLVAPRLERGRIGRRVDREVYLPEESPQREEAAAANVPEPVTAGEGHRVGAESDDAVTLAAGVQLIMRMRRLRSSFFEETLFADPAWDMMLDLMEARLSQANVSISSLCMAGCVPATTALRWVKILTEKGILVRKPDAGDRRRVYVELSDSAAEAMMGWLAIARPHLMRAGA
ncbi:MAG: hypothetical protein CVT77_03395 [Alphaproteobacteria bacterium HGW-Alphaproteobacteria-16]|nr:MAG: hypothetical protein CVT77_03395 [Alphaproteobacteria bacterium HGW-Alphaproteobacteria-16]